MSESPFFTPVTSPAPYPSAGTETPVAPSTGPSEIEILRAQVAALTAQVQTAAVRPDPNSAVRENGGGLGAEIHATWSQYDQELADQGRHPLQLAQSAPWVG